MHVPIEDDRTGDPTDPASAKGRRGPVIAAATDRAGRGKATTGTSLRVDAGVRSARRAERHRDEVEVRKRNRADNGKARVGDKDRIVTARDTARAGAGWAAHPDLRPVIGGRCVARSRDRQVNRVMAHVDAGLEVRPAIAVGTDPAIGRPRRTDSLKRVAELVKLSDAHRRLPV